MESELDILSFPCGILLYSAPLQRYKVWKGSTFLLYLHSQTLRRRIPHGEFTYIRWLRTCLCAQLVASPSQHYPHQHLVLFCRVQCRQNISFNSPISTSERRLQESRIVQSCIRVKKWGKIQRSNFCPRGSHIVYIYHVHMCSHKHVPPFPLLLRRRAFCVRWIRSRK